MNISKNTWHYKVAHRASIDDLKYGRVDFCRYLRLVVFGSLWTILKYAGPATIVLISLYGYWIMFHNSPKHSTSFQGFCVVVAMVATIFLFVFSFVGGLKYVLNSIEKRIRRLPRSTKQKEPGIFKLAYRSFKQKTCFLVNFKD